MSDEQSPVTKLPLKLTVAFSGTEGDYELYELTLEVPGNAESKTVTTVAFIPGEDTFTARVVRGASTPALPDRLIISFFKWGYGTMTQSDGSAVEWWLSDITRLSNRWFHPADVERLSTVVGALAHAAVAVEDMIVVRID